MGIDRLYICGLVEPLTLRPIDLGTLLASALLAYFRFNLDLLHFRFNLDLLHFLLGRVP